LHFCCTCTSLALHLPNTFIALLWDVAIASMETCSRRSVLNADTLICLARRWEQELNILDSWWHLAQSKPHRPSSGLSICDCAEIFVYILASYGNFRSRKISQKITTWSKKARLKKRFCGIQYRQRCNQRPRQKYQTIFMIVKVGNQIKMLTVYEQE
jgi:hypothetical protein